MPPDTRNDPAGSGAESKHKAGGLLAVTLPADTDCCRDMAAEIVREVNAALAGIKAAGDVLAAFASMLDGVTYTQPEDDPDDEPRNAYDEASMAAMMLGSEVDELLDRVRRVAWLHDLDHSAGTR